MMSLEKLLIGLNGVDIIAIFTWLIISNTSDNTNLNNEENFHLEDFVSSLSNLTECP